MDQTRANQTSCSGLLHARSFFLSLSLSFQLKAKPEVGARRELDWHMFVGKPPLLVLANGPVFALRQLELPTNCLNFTTTRLHPHFARSTRQTLAREHANANANVQRSRFTYCNLFKSLPNFEDHATSSGQSIF